MDINTIHACTTLSLSGEITFPEVVMKLAKAGVERYMVDLVSLQKHHYGTDGTFYTEPFPVKELAVAATFDATAVKSAISDSQQKKIDYQHFLQRITQAGCCHYEVFIFGRKATYCGRDGNQHIEVFPPTV